MIASKSIDRARKLLRLARSAANAHESALAHEQAQEYMARHGISPDAVAEDVTEVIDDKRDACREELARAIARSRGLELRANKRNSLALVGPADIVKRASELYRRLVSIAESSSAMPSSSSGVPPYSAREAWRICWWLGFTAALSDRLAPRDAAAPSSASLILLKHAGPVRGAVSDALEAFDSLAESLNGCVDDVAAVLDRLRDTAHARGHAAGERVELEGVT